ncbi:MAG TPA: hypothetical protein VIQ39_08400 [Methyloceanibacter sp.]
MLRLSPNFSRNVDWNLLKTFHEIAEAAGSAGPGALSGASSPRSASLSSGLRPSSA